jgi:CRISPR/Cas system-associated exonuclease Cas4 (RecB family)
VGAFKDLTCEDTPPFDVTRTLVAQVKEYATFSPRSQQTMIGASEIGTPCSRRLAYKLLNVEAVNTDTDSWPAIVGTSVHYYLERAFKKHPDYLTEVKVVLEPWTKGTADLVHLPSKTVIDHKVVGATALKTYKAKGMSAQYRVQLNAYALGLRLAGYEIENIAVMFWSRSGMMRDAFSITEPYDEALVEQCLARFDAIKAMVEMGTAALPLIPTTPTHCMYCPYFFPLSTDAQESCNGVKTVDPTQPTTIER